MNLFEFVERPNPDQDSYQDLADDQSQLKWGESRKTRLLLKEINRLRKMKEVQAYERAQNLKKIRKQYKPPAQPAI
jgi:predicted dithiol-disulfide oxidoreductase (DUF899 family)